jgi:oligopeptide/dipeptide ABC transporter ATP-binding protein
LSAQPTDSGAGGSALIEVDDLHTHFPVRSGLLSRRRDVVRAVDGVTFDIAPGEVFGLVGESGSGKTTLGRSLLGLVRATSGSVRYGGRDLVPLPERELRPLRRELALISQDPNASLNPAMTVGQGVGHPLRIHGLTTTAAETRDRVAATLERVGLTPGERFLDIYPEELSGGQRQRLVIARALITEPRFVVCDEPVAALDMSVRARVLELMLELQAELGLTYLFITHDLATARFLCDHIGILYLGNLVEWGTADALFDDPQHPYTRALLDAVPLPDPARRGRDKQLPTGEVPDAQTPPGGCRFHPRCPAAFDACGWEGADLIDFFERRWAAVDPATFEAELEATGGLDRARTGDDRIRFHAGDVEHLVALLERLRAEKAHPLFDAVEHVERDDGSVVVLFGHGPEPAAQRVAGSEVACHLHGITSRHRTTAP